MVKTLITAKAIAAINIKAVIACGVLNIAGIRANPSIMAIGENASIFFIVVLFMVLM
jgi:hypothetical protein